MRAQARAKLAERNHCRAPHERIRTPKQRHEPLSRLLRREPMGHLLRRGQLRRVGQSLQLGQEHAEAPTGVLGADQAVRPVRRLRLGGPELQQARHDLLALAGALRRMGPSRKARTLAEVDRAGTRAKLIEAPLRGVRRVPGVEEVAIPLVLAVARPERASVICSKYSFDP